MKFKSKISYLGETISILPIAEQLVVEGDVKKLCTYGVQKMDRQVIYQLPFHICDD